MRINRFRIENYRGLRLAQAGDLASRPTTILTGKNGTGKSLILEALTAVWTGNINLPEFVGPYGSSLRIELAVVLDEHEYEIVDAWRLSRDLERVERSGEHVLEAVSTNREETGAYTQRDEVLATLQNPLFAKDRPFASVDLLSARRQVSLTTTTSVDLQLLDRTAAAEQRRAMYEQEVRWKTGMQMPDVGSYLTSLDYRDFVAARAGVVTDREYERLQETFERASGKRISLPSYDPDSTKSDIQVRLPSGHLHALEDLSNGEREMLGMLYYVSQLSAQGGVLLLDEPEKHLHPTLQLSVLEALFAVAGRGQVFVVTHSPGLIASSPADHVLVVNSAWEVPGNQVQRVADNDEHGQLLADLGLARRDLLQAEFLAIVEGPDDERRLRMLLPSELAHAKVVVAGGRDAAIRTAQALRGLDLEVPWLAVVDRDFFSEREVSELGERGNIFVWSVRMLENVLLEQALLRECLLPALGEGKDIGDILRGIVDELKEPAIEQFIEARIRHLNPVDEGASNADGGLDKIERRLASEAAVWEYRRREYPRVRSEVTSEVERRWDAEWSLYVDGKRVISELQRRLPLYRSGTALIDALMVRAREDTRLMPPEAERLQRQMRELMQKPVLRDDADPVAGRRDKDVRLALSETESTPELNATFEGPYYGC